MILNDCDKIAYPQVPHSEAQPPMKLHSILCIINSNLYSEDKLSKIDKMLCEVDEMHVYNNICPMLWGPHTPPPPTRGYYFSKRGNNLFAHRLENAPISGLFISAIDLLFLISH